MAPKIRLGPFFNFPFMFVEDFKLNIHDYYRIKMTITWLKTNIGTWTTNNLIMRVSDPTKMYLKYHPCFNVAGNFLEWCLQHLKIAR